MTGRPIPPVPPVRATWLAPRYVLPVLAIVLVVAVLFTPQRGLAGATDQRLTTRSTQAYGARGLSEVLRRVGWRVEERLTPMDGPLATDAVYAVLAPAVDLTMSETRRLLDAVEGGASLLYVLRGRTLLADELDVRPSRSGGPMALDTAGLARVCEGLSSGGLIEWPGGRPFMLTVEHTGAVSTAETTFVSVATGRGARRGTPGRDTIELPVRDPLAERMPAIGDPAAIGFSLGRGRVVVVADPDLLRNDVLRSCRWNAGLTAVRMVEWLARRSPGEPAPARIVFDEYHQGHGRHASTFGAARHFLSATPPGRTLLQVALASLLLLLAAAPRPLSPASSVSFERRSPLEHVGALSRAYEQVGASRLAARRLVRGIRRRHAHGAWRRASDEEFLQSIAARHPALAADVALLVQATHRALPPTEFVQVGRAIETIERTLRQS